MKKENKIFIKNKKSMNKKASMAFSQIFILVFGIIAIGYALGSGVGEVRGEDCSDVCKNQGYITYAKENDITKCNNNVQRDSFDYSFISGCCCANPKNNDNIKTENVDKNIDKLNEKNIKSADEGSGSGTNAVEGFAAGSIFANQGEKKPPVVSTPVTNPNIQNTDSGWIKGNVIGEPGDFEVDSGGLFKRNTQTGEIRNIETDEIIYKGTEIDGGVSKLAPKEFGDSWISQTLKLPKGQYLDAIASGAQWAIIVYYGVQMLAPMLGADKEQTKALSEALGWGVFAGKSIYTLTNTGGAWSNWFNTNLGSTMSASTFSIGVGAAIALAYYYYNYKKENTKTITFDCQPWDAPTGGAKCEECNKQGILPCSEYQCRSLGQSCQLLNPGTGEEKCAWVNRQDVNPPEIRTLSSALIDDNYKYNPDNTISPPDRGVKVLYKDGCVKAFAPFSFGISTNEPAKCKLDYINKRNFSDMEFYFGGSSTLKYNHTQTMSLPGPSALKAENLTLKNDGDFELFVRCEDSNGNANTANFVFKYCVEKGPDTSPPVIVSTNLLNRMPIQYNQNSVNMELYVNEPADCKWSRTDQSYDKMENPMVCSRSVSEMNAQMLYKCSGELNGIKSETDNKFYFRCKDNPLLAETERIANTKSQPEDGFVIKGTIPLILDKVGPNGTIKDSTENVKVTLTAETSAGYKDGDANCYFSETGNDEDYTMFLYPSSTTQTNIHSQDLYLTAGTYTYYIKCIDLGGNADVNKTTFKVESDNQAPSIVRAYQEVDNLKLITNEKAECVYDVKECNFKFEDGLKMVSLNDNEHYVEWNTDINLYIKCKDDFGNQPIPNQCSIIARAFEESYSKE